MKYQSWRSEDDALYSNRLVIQECSLPDLSWWASSAVPLLQREQTCFPVQLRKLMMRRGTEVEVKEQEMHWEGALSAPPGEALSMLQASRWGGGFECSAAPRRGKAWHNGQVQRGWKR